MDIVGVCIDQQVSILMLGAIMVGILTGIMLCWFNCFAPVIQHIKKCKDKKEPDIKPDIKKEDKPIAMRY